jgi:hypothetical protein
VQAADVPAGVYEIGGADVLTYRDLLSTYADEVGTGRIHLRVPALPAPLPSALTDRLPQRARAALKLVESLGADSTVRTPARAFEVAPLSVREAIRLALVA